MTCRRLLERLVDLQEHGGERWRRRARKSSSFHSHGREDVQTESTGSHLRPVPDSAKLTRRWTKVVSTRSLKATLTPSPTFPPSLSPLYRLHSPQNNVTMQLSKRSTGGVVDEALVVGGNASSTCFSETTIRSSTRAAEEETVN